MTKIVVIGGTGLIGSKVVGRVAEHGNDAIAAALETGVNTVTGEGLADVLSGAQVVVDVSNSPSFEDQAVLDFFATSTGNLLAAEKTVVWATMLRCLSSGRNVFWRAVTSERKWR